MSQRTYRPGQCRIAVFPPILFQRPKDGRRAQKNTGIEAVEIGDSFADSTDLPIDRLYASHIIHVDEGIVNIAIHYECYFSIELGMGRQGAGKTRIKEVIRHEQQKRFVQNFPCLEY